MPDPLAQLAALPGLGWIAAAGFVAGLVRGFAGFGTAMIFLPVAGQFLPPIGALTTLIVMDAFGPLPNLRRAWRDGQPADVFRLIAGTLVMLPIGLALLLAVAPEVFRYAVSIVALVLLACLIAGLRYRGKLRPPMVYGIGGLAGFLGGVAGVPGPPVILFYMASPLPASAIRANTMWYLFLFDLVFLGVMYVADQLLLEFILVGLAVAIPVVIGNVAGAAMFRPGWERQYRALAYAIIAVSALSGLPLWD
ncbi:sulfite exporter TauE/SafE family protein [Aestuariicoccus sp. MJ-SS9]|uniref:sulfite exporter TauE/SafE family protein n=1 Tax=Aestuariicoccus sp. MJ-SS9 TaxID=3079855 RepID=UPI0029089B31|nr:sulfite exporter TauE/SafE family protein [Aestuariicoccus sp. MJ-SS9]MDU8911106.1 sulfite exporter TauE/SafE family protein [Aestuariicoccus sp. MJ-SS9]